MVIRIIHDVTFFKQNSGTWGVFLYLNKKRVIPLYPIIKKYGVNLFSYPINAIITHEPDTENRHPRSAILSLSLLLYRRTVAGRSLVQGILFLRKEIEHQFML
jgi:hypothetical protein